MQMLGPRSASALAVAAILAAFVALSLWEMHDESATYDEGPHLSAAYTALRLGDYRLVTEQPPLGRRIAAMSLLTEDVRLPSGPAWSAADHFRYGFEFLYQSGNDADRLLQRARLAMLSWGILLILSVYAVARRLFGPGGGVVAMAAAAFNPSILGHAHLVTTDVAPAALVLLAVAAFQLWLERAGALRAAAAGVLAGGAVATKFSALALGPIFALQLASWWWRSGGGEPSIHGAAPRQRGVVRWSGELASIALIAYAVIWGAYGFRYAASPDPSYDPLSTMQFGPRAWPPALAPLAAHQLLPEALLAGIAELGHHAQAGHSGFALGMYSQHGWWWYLPLAFLVKNPVSLLALVSLGVFAWWRGRRTSSGAALVDGRAAPRRTWGTAIAAAAAVCAGIAMASPLAMGIRHLLLAFPFAFVACGAAASLGRGGAGGRWTRRCVGVLVVGLVAECLVESPHHLAYFNAPTLALAPREHVLTDSNLDWGQDLGRLKRYMDAHGVERIKLAYFGMASPRQLGLRNEVLSEKLSLYPKLEPEWVHEPTLAPGDLVAMSLYFHFGDHQLAADVVARGDVVATVGRSIRVYRIRSP
jgi:hypothetical protein